MFKIKTNDGRWLCCKLNEPVSLAEDERDAFEWKKIGACRNVIKNPPKVCKGLTLEVVANESKNTATESVVATNDVMKNIIDQLDGYNEQAAVSIEEKIKTVDLKIIDVLHFVELSDFSASQGYKFAKKLKDLRIERRELKDRYAIVKAISEAKVKFIKDVEEKLSELTYREYTPRKIDSI